MRLVTFIILSLLIPTIVQSQEDSQKFKAEILKSDYVDKKDIKAEILPFDISGLLTKTSNASVFGFIGSDYQRIRIKIASIIKNKDLQDQYFVYGKSMVKENICEFQGLLKITNAFNLKDPDIENVRQGIIIGEYTFYENPSQKHVGQFNGIFKLNWYLDKQGQIQYNDLADVADEFSNNEFVGTWASYNGKIIKPCHWGDHRIPMSGDLDVGTGEFVPDNKYIANGWLTYMQAFSGISDGNSEEARKKEQAVWWK